MSKTGSKKPHDSQFVRFPEVSATVMADETALIRSRAFSSRASDAIGDRLEDKKSPAGSSVFSQLGVSFG